MLLKAANDLSSAILAGSLLQALIVLGKISTTTLAVSLQKALPNSLPEELLPTSSSSRVIPLLVHVASRSASSLYQENVTATS